MDLNKMVMDSLTKLHAEGKVQEIVEKKVSETVKSIVEDAFGSWSDFSKGLKKQVQEQININFSQLDIASYNTMVLNVVKEKMDEAVHSQGVEKLKESLENMLSDVKKEYKLSELIHDMKEEAVEYDEDLYGKEISFHDDKDRRVLRFISFDPEEDKSEYECKYRISIDNEGKLNTAKINEREFNNRVIMGGLHGVEETLFKIYSTGAKIIVDVDDIDFEYGYENEDY